jgi:hypothetical protein
MRPGRRKAVRWAAGRWNHSADNGNAVSNGGDSSGRGRDGND